MRNLVFVCTYRGSAAPQNEAGSELKANTSGTRVIPLDGGELPDGIGNSPIFESIVTVGEDGRFGEHGSIDLGGGNTMRFREISPGTMVPGPTGGSVGAIDWNIESGTGVFEDHGRFPLLRPLDRGRQAGRHRAYGARLPSLLPPLLHHHLGRYSAAWA